MKQAARLDYLLAGLPIRPSLALLHPWMAFRSEDSPTGARAGWRSPAITEHSWRIYPHLRHNIA